MTGRRSVAVDCNWLRQAFALVFYLFCHIIILPCQRLSVYVWTDYLAWNWKGKAIRVGYDLLGKGPTLLLLPALSSISTRHEMRPLQERLASAFSTITIDWPSSKDTDLLGYNIYRSTSPTTGFVKLNPNVFVGSSYVDGTAPKGTVYYWVTAIDESGNESSPKQVSGARK